MKPTAIALSALAMSGYLGTQEVVASEGHKTMRGGAIKLGKSVVVCDKPEEAAQVFYRLENQEPLVVALIEVNAGSQSCGMIEDIMVSKLKGVGSVEVNDKEAVILEMEVPFKSGPSIQYGWVARPKVNNIEVGREESNEF